MDTKKHGRAVARFLGFAVLLAVAAADGQDPPTARKDYVRGVLEGRLPVYALTNAPLEAAVWLPGNTVLAVQGNLPADGVWVPVAPPDAASVWIYRDLVRDGAVVADKSLIRSGAGTAFRPVASLDKGTPVDVRGVYGDWLKIRPPPATVFWVLRDHVEPFAGQPDIYTALVEALTNDTPDAPLIQDAPPPPAPPELEGYVLDGAARQGRRVTLSGTLDWGGVDAVAAPFCLVAREQSGDAAPLCNLLAPAATYGPYIGSRVTVEGTRWIVKGSRLPFVIPLAVRMEPDPPARD